MDLPPFVPHPLLPGGYAQTLGGHLLGRPPCAGSYRDLEVTLDDGDRLLLHIDLPRQAETTEAASPNPVVLLMHGLGGSAESSYILRISRHLTHRGYRVARFNHRGCGHGAALARQVYHAGRVLDLDRALDRLATEYPQAPLIACGFSLSGNLLLRYLGQAAAGAAPWRVHPHLSAAVAVCPPVDLALCASALAAPRNRLLNHYYTRVVRHQIIAKHQLFPELIPPKWPRRLDIAQIDESYTAPRSGFANRQDYYRQSAARPWLAHIATPTLLVSADDDPIVPLESFAEVRPSASLHHVRHAKGGHMGFMAARPTALGDLRWMDAAVVSFVLSRSIAIGK